MTCQFCRGGCVNYISVDTTSYCGPGSGLSVTFGAKLTAVVVVMLEVGILVSDLTLSLSIQKKLKLKNRPKKSGFIANFCFGGF